MSKEELLVQDEIDALLNSVNAGDGGAGPGEKKPDQQIRAFDPATQHRIIRERLHALDIINERFARLFRISLFNLIRRNPDITVNSVDYYSYSAFSRNVPMPANINVISMKPLRGSSLAVFPPNMVFMVVDSLFGGDGRFLTKSEGRDFTNTEQRIIQRMLTLATDAYQEAWQTIYPLEISHLRSEMQARFANITNSPNEVVVNTTFHLEVGSLSSEFQICLPYSMLEPIKDLLTSPMTEHDGKQDKSWTHRMAGEIKQSQVELVAEFVQIDSRIGDVVALKVGDVIPFELPTQVHTKVDGVPVLECHYGIHNSRRALRVLATMDHSLDAYKAAAGKAPVSHSQAEDLDHDKQ